MHATTFLPARGDDNGMFNLQSYQELIIDKSHVYNKSYPQEIEHLCVNPIRRIG